MVLNKKINQRNMLKIRCFLSFWVYFHRTSLSAITINRNKKKYLRAKQHKTGNIAAGNFLNLLPSLHSVLHESLGR